MAELVRRKKLRWEGYDYASEGAYFLTLCVQNRHPLLAVGAICDRPNRNFELTDAGKCVCDELHRLSTVYDHIVVDRFCIMPDHIHMILIIWPKEEAGRNPDDREDVGEYRAVDGYGVDGSVVEGYPADGYAADGRSQIAPTDICAAADKADTPSPTVSRIVQQFKGSVTKRLGFSVWQKSFYDRVIRKQEEYRAYCRYIALNPIRSTSETFPVN